MRQGRLFVHWIQCSTSSSCKAEMAGNSSITGLVNCMSVCRINTDVVFVFYSSRSISTANYQLVRNHAYNFTQYLLSGADDDRWVLFYLGNTHIMSKLILTTCKQDLLKMSSRQSLSCGNGGGTIKSTAKVIHNRRPTIIFSFALY